MLDPDHDFNICERHSFFAAFILIVVIISACDSSKEEEFLRVTSSV